MSNSRLPVRHAGDPARRPATAPNASMPAIRLAALPPVLALLSLFAIAAWPADAGARQSAAPNGAQPLLRLDHRVVARAHPSPGARAVGAVEARTPLTRSPTVLPVLRTARGPAGGRWLRVRLPMRPNGVSGWVPADSGSISATTWRIVVHRGDRRAVVLRGTRVLANYKVVVGQPTTPTPLGTFFIVEKVRVAPGVTEGPWALATSAYSDVLHEFAGGPGQVALHGIVGLAAPLGTAASHGCVRFDNTAITWLATHVDEGTPLVIQP
jgi:lipoprotein-anchoring transpeptidase ErfK/SrfK